MGDPTANGSAFDYDLIAIGSGPGGQRAAIQAAKLGKRVAVVERAQAVGGVCVATGTIPSKTLREATMALSGYRERGFYGSSYTVKQQIGIEDLRFRSDQVVRNETDVVRHQLMRNGIDIFAGHGAFADPHTVVVDEPGGHGRQTLGGRHVVIATGTTVARDDHIPFDGRRILTSDDIVTMDRLPRTLAVIGAGVIGLEYASMFASLGVRVTLIDKRARLLPYIDAEIMDALAFHLRHNRMTLWLGEEVSGLELDEDDQGKVRIHLASGKHIIAEKALYSIGRVGATATLDLEAAGLAADDRGRLEVNEHYRTAVPHIYAVGDVIGFPSLASTSLEQGRLAACHAFGIAARSVPALIPYAIYRPPEADLPLGHARAPGRPHHRRGRQRADPHRPGRDGLPRVSGALRRGGLQLPDARRVLQDGRPRRAQPTRLLADERVGGGVHAVAPPAGGTRRSAPAWMRCGGCCTCHLPTPRRRCSFPDAAARGRRARAARPTRSAPGRPHQQT